MSPKREPTVVGLLKLERRSLTDQVLTFLRDRIISGGLAPGARLQEGELARSLGVSRLPVRDALRQLEAVGFVVAGPDGRHVVALTQRDIEQLYRLRQTLEPLAVRLAAQNHAAENCAALRAKLQEMCDALVRHDASAFSRIDIEMHHLIWEQADDPHLLRILDLVIAPLFMHLARYAEQLGWEETLRWHEALAQHICEGDEQAAQESMKRHLEYSVLRSRSLYATEKEVQVSG